MRIFVILSLILPCLFAEELRLVAYNIHHGEGMDGKLDLERIAKVIAAEKPDLVALQEVDNRCKRSGGVDQAAELAKLLKMEHRFGKFMDYQGGEYGMAILSRLPIEETIIHKLPKGAEPRIALEVVVKSPSWPGKFSFVGIHNDWIKEALRVQQIKVLQTGLKDRKYPVILAGDFNAEPKSDSLMKLEKDGWKMLRQGRKNTWSASEPKVEIDFFFAKGLPVFQFQDTVIAETVASDHRPIAVVISANAKKKD
ncbi:MAG: endonuclease/exonuclease/phosphatase family protein [Akkermansiaceae bacterium]|jgi:endonuclease/exonuclease/phosphatase family metal-dependent hydrolase|nr:endonuclease/exonuclease/phosphatase family protein [Akkermansiaceae bacterium]